LFSIKKDNANKAAALKTRAQEFNFIRFNVFF
jgi:hypothetical protein